MSDNCDQCNSAPQRIKSFLVVAGTAREALVYGIRGLGTSNNDRLSRKGDLASLQADNPTSVVWTCAVLMDIDY